MTDEEGNKSRGRARGKKAKAEPEASVPQDPLVIHGGRESIEEPTELGDQAIDFQDFTPPPVSLDDSAIHSMGDTDSLDEVKDLPFPDRDSLEDHELHSMAETVHDLGQGRPRTISGEFDHSDERRVSGELLATDSLEEESATFVYEMSLEISFDPDEEEESLQEEASLGGADFSPPLDAPSDKLLHREVLSKTIVHNMGRHLRRLGMANRQFRELKSSYYRERDRTDVSAAYFCSRDEPFLVSVALRYRSSFLSAVDVKVVFECPRTSPDLGVPPGTTDYYSVRRPDGMYALFYGYSPEIRELGQHTGVGSFVQRGITQYVVDCYSFAMAQGMDFGKMGEATLQDPKYGLGDPHTPMKQLADFARVVADT